MAKPVIIAVDDEVDVLRAVERDLRAEYSSKYRILRAESGVQALDTLHQLRVRNEPVALFVSDQRMPDMTGVEFLEQALAIFQQSGDRYYVELILTRLSNLFYQLALYEKAQAFSEQAVHLAAGTGHQSILAEALLYAGRIWAAQQQPAQAAAAYQQALTLWQESGQADWVMTTKAELAWLAYTEQDYAGALHLVEQVLGQQTTEILNFTSDPFQVAWLCYKVLLVNGDPRAPAVLADAHRQLLTQAATINDEALRQSFLEKVAANRAILEASQT